MIFSCWKHTIIAEIEEKLFLIRGEAPISTAVLLFFNRRHLPSSPTTSAASDTAEVMDEGQFDLTRSGINSAFEFDFSGYKSVNYLIMGRPSVSKFEHIGSKIHASSSHNLSSTRIPRQFTSYLSSTSWTPMLMLPPTIAPCPTTPDNACKREGIRSPAGYGFQKVDVGSSLCGRLVMWVR